MNWASDVPSRSAPRTISSPFWDTRRALMPNSGVWAPCDKPYARCKAALQQAYGLAQGAHTPLFGMSARLVSQKGLDIVLGADLLGSSDAQFIFLGSGEHRYHAALTELAAANPERVAVEFAFTDHLEHGLLAGADLLLMPSLYEPCGLTQMRAQRYGAIPVARRVGGLHDSIADGEAGFLFNAYEPAALEQAVERALERYGDRAARSEEHTSELQSRLHLVCRLLLEKKKNEVI